MIYDLRIKIILHSGLIGLLGYLFIGLFLPIANAQTMSNQNYIIQTQNINTTINVGTNTQNQEFKTDPSILEGVNYKVKMGFDTINNVNPFSVSLSTNIIDFGALSPTNPVIRTIDLSVNNPPAYGYSVIVFEDKPLTVIPTGKDFIPDTTCDNGACGTENAAEWTNALTYGFGYRCDNLTGLDCDNSFVKTNFYKHFPDIINNDDPQSIMSGIGSNEKQIRVSYKINTSGNQAQGIYNNIITYIAVPNF